MSNIKLVRTGFVPTKEQKAVFWNVLSAMVRPLTETHDTQFRKKIARLVNANPGQITSWNLSLDRNGKFTAKFFVMVHHAYDSWDPDSARTKRAFAGQPIRKSFDDFRADVIVAAGFFDVTYNLDGTISKSSKSLAFDSMDEDEFEQVYSAVADVLLDTILRNYKRDDLDRVVAELLDFTR